MKWRCSRPGSGAGWGWAEDAPPKALLRFNGESLLKRHRARLAHFGLPDLTLVDGGMVLHGYDKAMGARPMARLVQTTLKGPLANEILFGKLVTGGTAHIDLKAGEITIDCEPAKPAEDDKAGEDDDAPKPPRPRSWTG